VVGGSRGPLLTQVAAKSRRQRWQLRWCRAAAVVSRSHRRLPPSDTDNNVDKVMWSPKANDFGAIYWVAQK
jgi:hypothetical protein